MSRPEVIATSTRRDRRWVASGDAWYVVYDGERRWAMELAVYVRPPKADRSPQATERAFVAGHPAEVAWKTRRRGLPWRRHDVTFMTVTFECPYTERKIKLEFSGWCPREAFREILELLRHLRCH